MEEENGKWTNIQSIVDESSQDSIRPPVEYS